MFFTPRELFKYVVLIALIISMMGQLILWMVCISFAEIATAVTRLRETLIRVGFSPLFPAVTSTVGIFPSELFVYLNIK